MTFTVDDAKRAARVLRRELNLAGEEEVTHARALEIVAHQLGHRDWNTAAARLPGGQGPALGVAVPVLRILDQASAYAFYLDYLGFTVQWEHRFEPELPIYARLARSEAVIDLSEHYGDGTPGSGVWIPVADVDALHAELSSKQNVHSRPGIDRDAPGGPTLTVWDPFSNTLHFCQQR